MNNRTPEKPKPPTTPLPGRFSRSLLGWVLVVSVGMALMMYLGQMREGRRQIPSNQFWTYLESGQVVGDIVVSKNRIEGQLAEDTSGLGKGESRKFYVVYAYEADRDFQSRIDAALEPLPRPGAALRQDGPAGGKACRCNCW